MVKRTVPRPASRGPRGERGERGETGPRGEAGPITSKEDILAAVADQFTAIQKQLDLQLIRTGEIQAELDLQRQATREVRAQLQQIQALLKQSLKTTQRPTQRTVTPDRQFRRE